MGDALLAVAPRPLGRHREAESALDMRGLELSTRTSAYFMYT